MERLASRYFAAGSAQANNGIYATLGSDGSQKWFTKLNGYGRHCVRGSRHEFGWNRMHVDRGG